MNVKELISKYKKSKLYSLHGVVRIENVIKDLEQLKTIEYNPKVKIPNFAAEWLEIKKKNKDSLHVSIDGDWQIMPEVMKEWLFVEFNDEVFARAWLDGYEVEEDPKYYVPFTDTIESLNVTCLKKYDRGIAIGVSAKGDLGRSLVTQLTEKEIKDIDERYWSFAVPVEEVLSKVYEE